MAPFIDLSHDFADGMPGFTTTLPDGAHPAAHHPCAVAPELRWKSRVQASMPIRAFAEVT
jgi:hypothetical protein